MTSYIDKIKYDSIGQARKEPSLATAKLHDNTFLLDGLRVQIPKCTHGFVPGY
jgi:hypothetical protein